MTICLFVAVNRFAGDRDVAIMIKNKFNFIFFRRENFRFTFLWLARQRVTCGWSCAIFLIEVIYWIVPDDAWRPRPAFCRPKHLLPVARSSNSRCSRFIVFASLYFVRWLALCNPLFSSSNDELFASSFVNQHIAFRSPAAVRFKPIKNDVNRQSVEQIMWLSVIKTSISSTLDWDGFDSCRNSQFTQFKRRKLDEGKIMQNEQSDVFIIIKVRIKCFQAEGVFTPIRQTTK